MKDLTSQSLSALIDNLAIQTDALTKMMKDGYTKEEYTACKTMIDRLTTEIKLRKQQNQKEGV